MRFNKEEKALLRREFRENDSWQRIAPLYPKFTEAQIRKFRSNYLRWIWTDAELANKRAKQQRVRKNVEVKTSPASQTNIVFAETKRPYAFFTPLAIKIMDEMIQLGEEYTNQEIADRINQEQPLEQPETAQRVSKHRSRYNAKNHTNHRAARTPRNITAEPPSTEQITPVEKLHLSDVMRNFSVEDLRKAFEDDKKDEIEKTPVVVDQYGSVNIDEFFIPEPPTLSVDELVSASRDLMVNLGLTQRPVSIPTSLWKAISKELETRPEYQNDNSFIILT